MSGGPSGVLVLDKPRGPTSHDAVARCRRALGTRSVGHAGTLDPMATGVLVIAVGEGTKLVSHLTGQDKEYVATLRLGLETDSLDADGAVVGESPVPGGLDLDTVRAAAERFVGTHAQEAPLISAIKVRGRALHRRARAGESVEAPVRTVTVHALSVLSVEPPEITFRVRCAKGFYVRSLGRDLARSLGTVGHLRSLRRIRSGRFDVDAAVPWDTLEAAAGGDPQARDRLRAALHGLREAWGEAPVAELTAAGLADARHGRPVSADGVVGDLPALSGDEVVALCRDGRLVALARRDGPALRVARGIRDEGA